MHHAVGLAGLVAAIGFAFGQTTARVCVGVALVAMTCAALYIGFLVVTDAI